jgi:phosphatidylserine decarboxylase
MIGNVMLLGALLALACVLPLAWKWHLGVRRVAFFVTAVAVLYGLLIGLVQNVIPLNFALQTGLVWLLTLVTGFVVLAYHFYRDPERATPARDDVIVSPADGEVIYIREARGGVLPVSSKHGRNYALTELTRTALQSDEASIIGISMSFLDVHVNRAPIAGQVIFQRHFPGRFGSLRRPEMVFENERVTTVILRNGVEVAVVQIASRLVRQIASFVREGQHVALGQRIGVIRLGSQVDIVLPVRDNVSVTVKPGQRVTAGQSIIAVFKPTEDEDPPTVSDLAMMSTMEQT